MYFLLVLSYTATCSGRNGYENVIKWNKIKLNNEIVHTKRSFILKNAHREYIFCSIFKKNGFWNQLKFADSKYNIYFQNNFFKGIYFKLKKSVFSILNYYYFAEKIGLKKIFLPL